MIGLWPSSESLFKGKAMDGEVDSSRVPSLNDELENLILARVPRSEYLKIMCVNRRKKSLVESGELFKIRRENGIVEPSVFICMDINTWLTFDRDLGSKRMLPRIQADYCFLHTYKEAFCAGNHLLVSGREADDFVLWRFALGQKNWKKGPSMITPRTLFASVSFSDHAFIAGGVTIIETAPNGFNAEILSSAEKYNLDTESWEALPMMHRRRKRCSGFYMDNKYFVIGGVDENGKGLTCGEAFDGVSKTWEIIPNMLESQPSEIESPPLVAVVNNELYRLETSANELKVYLKANKTWKNLGPLPGRAASRRNGWGVAFRSLGNELVVIGGSPPPHTHPYWNDTVAVYACYPDPGAEGVEWRTATFPKILGDFVSTSTVMLA